ncbi:MAG: DUF2239 family protein [Polaromonas sp.]|nr:DUF2239 family protein [Polaromonas sp.]
MPILRDDSAETNATYTACYTAFYGHSILATGSANTIIPLLRVHAHNTSDQHQALLVFDDHTGRQTELDLRDPLAVVADAATPGDSGERETTGSPASSGAAPRGPGRPRLGVVAREVTLLPRQWEWLNHQPGGASVALRRLVDDARRSGAGADAGRRAQEATYAFISAIAGDLAGFEDAARALFARDAARFTALTTAWPADIQAYAHRLAAPSFTSGGAAGHAMPKTSA